MLEAAFWGFVGGFALIVGAVLGLAWNVSSRVVGAVMAFGAGVEMAGHRDYKRVRRVQFWSDPYAFNVGIAVAQ